VSHDLIDGAREVRAGEEIDAAALDAFLARELTDWSALPGALEIQQFPSGYSNLTYLLRKGRAELVLRRPPFAVQVKGGHDMAREFRVLTGLEGVYAAAPRPLAYCEDEGVIGAPFYVMERRRGLVLRRELPERLAGDPDLMRRMCLALVDNLASLHAVDTTAAGLDGLGKPEGYVRRQVEGWIGRWQKAKTDEVPEIERIAGWLVERMPPDGDATLVHNDYKFDNVMLDPEDPTRIVAVLDWELCTRGDPLMDLGTTLGYWVEAGDDPAWQAMAFGPTMAPGAPSRHELAERYAERTGRDVSNMVYYYCFALLKIAVIVQQIFYRYHKGFTRDPRFARLDAVVAALGRTAVAAAEAGRI
jgi:aminoglycoside phosphotransferase (APT) family kinase protein